MFWFLLGMMFGPFIPELLLSMLVIGLIIEYGTGILVVGIIILIILAIACGFDS